VISTFPFFLFPRSWNKQQCLKEVAFHEIGIHTVEKSIDGLQDTSNSDVFGVSVKHGKAAEPLQRCLAKRSSPVYIRQLHQDECRELRRRGLKEVMNRSGRVLRGQLVDGKVHPKVKYIAHFSKIYSTNDCCQKNEESVKVENLFSQEEL
jgi:hypothetical protein